MQNRPASENYFRPLEQFRVADLEALRIVLRGGSVIDWHRLNFASRDEALEFVRAQEFDLDNESDAARATAIKNEAISYLRRNYDFPIPKPVAALDLVDLLLLAS